MRKVFAGLVLALVVAGMSPSAGSQPLVRMYGMDGTNSTSATNPLPTNSFGVALSLGTSTNVTVTTAAQTVVLKAANTQITLSNTSATNTIYFQPFGGNATSANFPITPGQAFTWSTSPGITQFSLIASGSGTVVGVLAH